MPTKVGKHTLRLNTPPSITAFAAIGGKMEQQGPLGNAFDLVSDDNTFGQQTWEKSESQMQKLAVSKALEKAGISSQDLDFLFAGDLLNQCIGSNYGLRELGVPFFGLYGACSTMAESLILASLFVESSIGSKCAAVTSSHFCSAERQFRFPLEYGGQRPPTAQWTATASGCAVVMPNVQPPYVRAVCTGTIEDLGIKDANNMGAAMAPAAAKTIQTYFEDTCTNADCYDLIFTGDLGQVGSDLLAQLLKKENISLGNKHRDCGLLLYDREKQPGVLSGGSGCGCSASVLCTSILPQLRDGMLNNILFIATGALMSTTSVQQGESIPGIAHLLYLSSEDQRKGMTV